MRGAGSKVGLSWVLWAATAGSCSYDRFALTPPVTGEIVIDRDLLMADGADYAAVRVHVRDYAGNPVSRYPVKVEADPTVQVDQPESRTDDAGILDATLRASSPVAATVTARLDPEGFDHLLPPRRRVRFVSERSLTLTLAPAAELAVGPDPCALGAGDFDGDGWMDLVAASCSAATLSVLRGGAAGFAPALPHAIDAPAVALAVADFDGDGRADVVAATPGTSSVLLLHGADGGGFRDDRAELDADGLPRALAIADLDGVAGPEVLVVHGNAGGVSVLRSPAPGVLERVQVLPDVALAPVAVAVADLDGDGALDAAVADEARPYVALIHNDGSGNLEVRGAWACGPGNALIVGDLDGQTGIDLVLADAAAGAVYLRSSADPDACAPQPVAQPRALGVADLNGDRQPDIVVAGGHSAGTAQVRLGRSGGGFEPALALDVGRNPSALAILDLDGDGRLDLAVANRGSGTVARLLSATRSDAP